MPLDISLQDFAKFAYGNGAFEGKKGGTGYLTLNKDNGISKVFTHGNKAKELSAIVAAGGAEFEVLKRGSVQLRDRLLELASKALDKSPNKEAKLQELRTLLGVGEGQDGGSPAKSLLSRKIVAKSLSLIDGSVWTDEVKSAAKTLTTNKLDTVSKLVLKNEIGAEKAVGDNRDAAIADFKKWMSSCKLAESVLETKGASFERSYDILAAKLFEKVSDNPSLVGESDADTWVRTRLSKMLNLLTKSDLLLKSPGLLSESAHELLEAEQSVRKDLSDYAIRSMSNKSKYVDGVLDAFKSLSGEQFEEFVAASTDSDQATVLAKALSASPCVDDAKVAIRKRLDKLLVAKEMDAKFSDFKSKFDNECKKLAEELKLSVDGIRKSAVSSDFKGQLEDQFGKDFLRQQLRCKQPVVTDDVRQRKIENADKLLRKALDDVRVWGQGLVAVKKDFQPKALDFAKALADKAGCDFSKESIESIVNKNFSSQDAVSVQDLRKAISRTLNAIIDLYVEKSESPNLIKQLEKDVSGLKSSTGPGLLAFGDDYVKKAMVKVDKVIETKRQQEDKRALLQETRASLNTLRELHGELGRSTEEFDKLCKRFEALAKDPSQKSDALRKTIEKEIGSTVAALTALAMSVDKANSEILVCAQVEKSSDDYDVADRSDFEKDGRFEKLGVLFQDRFKDGMAAIGEQEGTDPVAKLKALVAARTQLVVNLAGDLKAHLKQWPSVRQAANEFATDVKRQILVPRTVLQKNIAFVQEMQSFALSRLIHDSFFNQVKIPTSEDLKAIRGTLVEAMKEKLAAFGVSALSEGTSESINLDELSDVELEKRDIALYHLDQAVAKGGKVVISGEAGLSFSEVFSKKTTERYLAAFVAKIVPDVPSLNFNGEDKDVWETNTAEDFQKLFGDKALDLKGRQANLEQVRATLMDLLRPCVKMEMVDKRMALTLPLLDTSFDDDPKTFESLVRLSMAIVSKSLPESVDETSESETESEVKTESESETERAEQGTDLIAARKKAKDVYFTVDIKVGKVELDDEQLALRAAHQGVERMINPEGDLKTHQRDLALARKIQDFLKKMPKSDPARSVFESFVNSHFDDDDLTLNRQMRDELRFVEDALTKLIASEMVVSGETLTGRTFVYSDITEMLFVQAVSQAAELVSIRRELLEDRLSPEMRANLAAAAKVNVDRVQLVKGSKLPELPPVPELSSVRPSLSLSARSKMRAAIGSLERNALRLLTASGLDEKGTKSLASAVGLLSRTLGAELKNLTAEIRQIKGDNRYDPKLAAKMCAERETEVLGALQQQIDEVKTLIDSVCANKTDECQRELVSHCLRQTFERDHQQMRQVINREYDGHGRVRSKEYEGRVEEMEGPSEALLNTSSAESVKRGVDSAAWELDSDLKTLSGFTLGDDPERYYADKMTQMIRCAAKAILPYGKRYEADWLVAANVKGLTNMFAYYSKMAPETFVRESFRNFDLEKEGSYTRFASLLEGRFGERFPVMFVPKENAQEIVDGILSGSYDSVAGRRKLEKRLDEINYKRMPCDMRTYRILSEKNPGGVSGLKEYEAETFEKIAHISSDPEVRQVHAFAATLLSDPDIALSVERDMSGVSGTRKGDRLAFVIQQNSELVSKMMISRRKAAYVGKDMMGTLEPDMARAMRRFIDGLISLQDDAYETLREQARKGGYQPTIPSVTDQDTNAREVRFLANTAESYQKERLDKIAMDLDRDVVNACSSLQKMLEGKIDNIFGQDTDTKLEKPLSEASLEEIMSTGTDKTLRLLKGVLKGYLPSMSTADQSAMLASVTRLTDRRATEGQKLGAMLKAAGPILQKMLQGLDINQINDPDMREAIVDMRDNLAPIPVSSVHRMLDDIVSRSRDISSIKIVKSLGAASIGQALKCEIAYDDGRTEPCVIKLLRPEAKYKAMREQHIFKEVARSIPGMERTFNGRLKSIMAELNLGNERANVVQGMSSYAIGSNEQYKTFSDVHTMELVDGIPGTPGVMALKEVQGTTLARFLESVENVAKDPNVTPEALEKQFAEAKRIHEALANLSYMWCNEGLLSSNAFYHGDLHAGNIMVGPDGATFIDFGNAAKLTQEEAGCVVKAVAGMAANFPQHFVEGFEGLLSPEGRKIFLNHKAEILEMAKTIAAKGTMTDVAQRLACMFKLLQDNFGIEIPPALNNFNDSQKRLMAAMEGSIKSLTALQEAYRQRTGGKSLPGAEGYQPRNLINCITAAISNNVGTAMRRVGGTAFGLYYSLQFSLKAQNRHAV